MKDIEHAAMMVGMATKDLRALQGMLDNKTFADEVFGFHAQQIVEKSLKAWLSLLGREYPRIHDLEQLFNLLEDQGIQIPAHFRDLTDLTEYSVQFRYEYLDETNDAIDRLSTISNVKELFHTVQSAVDKENRHR
jgi:HEPN domain-containing protein